MSLTADQLVRLAVYSVFEFAMATAAHIAELTSGGVTSLHSHAGGGGVSTLTSTVATDADTFLVEHVFDLGKAMAAVTVTATLVSHDADTEVWDPQTGVVVNLAVETSPSVGFAIPLSFDNSASNSAYPWLAWRTLDLGSPHELVNDTESDYAVFVSLRYLRVSAQIYDENTGHTYAGANHPTAQVRFDLSYI